MKPRTAQFEPYFEEGHQFPHYKKGRLKSYYRKKWFRLLFKNKDKE